MDTLQRKANPNPGEAAGYFSNLCHLWIAPLFLKGGKKTLEVDDLYDPLDADRSEWLGDTLASQWGKELELQKLKPSHTPSFLRSLLRSFSKDLILGGIPLVGEMSLTIIQNVFLGKLLSHFRSVPVVTREEAIMYAGGMLACTFFAVMCRNRYDISSYHLGLRMKAACCSVIYRKALRLSCDALGEKASGQVVNLLASDVSRFEMTCLCIHYMWVAPLMTFVVVALFYQEGGLPAMLGFCVLLSTTVLQSLFGRLSSKIIRLFALRTDERVRLVNEVISGIQVIKMYAWEKSFKAVVRKARKYELFELRKSYAIRAVFMLFHMTNSRLCLFASVFSLYLVGDRITAEKVFVFQSYFIFVSWVMGGVFIRGTAEVLEAITSVRRIQGFLMHKEHLSNHSTQTNGIDTSYISAMHQVANSRIIPSDNKATTNRIVLDHIEAKWNCDSSQLTLSKVNANIPEGQLLAIIGPVGSGKSSILQVILGELTPCRGKVTVNGSIAYAPQDAWVFSATVRQNILFGSAYDEERYRKVVEACSLLKDFRQFPDYDLTVVGERGVSLSGGQKARISLARAVYREADIYLLDDPLSAVDTQVGKHLFEACIKGLLGKKTVVLVTHQLQFVKDADIILLIENGCCLSTGTWNDIVHTGRDYAMLLKSEVDEENLRTETGCPPLSKEIKYSQPLENMPLPSFKSTCISDSNQTLCSDKVENVNKKSLDSGIDTLETSSKGMVKGSVYLNYLKSSRSNTLSSVVVILFLVTQLSTSLTDYWVSYWVKVEDSKYAIRRDMNSTAQLVVPFAPVESSSDDTIITSTLLLSSDTCAYIYAGVVLTTFLLCILRSFLYFLMILKISKSLHESMFDAVVGTFMRFFDTNPSGRILNRFTKDMGTVDELLPRVILDAVQVNLILTGAAVLTVVTNYYLILPLVAMFIFLRFLRNFYLRSSKEIQRMEGMARSPVFSYLNVTLQGMTTIRAFGAQRHLMQDFDKHQDLHTGARYLQLVGASAFAYITELSTLCYNALVFCSIFFNGNQSLGSEVGLTITQCIMLLGQLQWGLRQSAEVANNMMSAERILEYVQLSPEQKKKNISREPAKGWPQKGAIKLDHIYLRYSAHGEPVLRDVSISINPGEKIGIVGRTGAGKSSLIAALLRMALVEGNVVIDDFNSGDVSLERLRSAISIIPQDPVLFSGTMRYNLDPFNEYPDERLWEALEEVELKDVLSTEQGLDSKVFERGGNFSVGQRQLVCLARAILRNNKILMMDEATANVDPQTDKLIQTTIRKKFQDCTVLTVAHRLNTVIDCDRIVVMESGRVAEFDHPWKLLEDSNSVFTRLVNQLEGHGADHLYHIAKNHYEELFSSTRL